MTCAPWTPRIAFSRMYCPHCSNTCEPQETACPACGEPLDTTKDRRVGTVLPGGYVLQECIGGGGMGQVYRAEQSALGRSVAVKIVHPYLLSDDDVAGRFINEARLASRLNHPNSVAVIDFGRTADGLLYLVMEHLRGRDLARVIVEDWPLSIERTIDILRQLLDVLSEAHQLGIVHLDLKPDNIVLEPTRQGGDFVKVVDFGLARMLAGSSHTSGPSQTISGTPDYMSPEQCRGEQPDARSDLYAVGIVLFLMLTGRLPFEAAAPTQVLLNHLTVPAPDPRTFNPGIPDGLSGIILKALEKSAGDRFQSAAEFSGALAEVKFQITAPVRMLSIPPGAPTKPCSVCGEPVPMVQKFCGGCGARMPWASQVPSLRPPSIRLPEKPDILPFPLTARDDALEQLGSELDRSGKSLRLCRVEGEVGVGKTRLLEEFDLMVSALDHAVFWVRAEPWPICPPWESVRKLIPALTARDPQRLLSSPTVPPRAAKGLHLLFGSDDGNPPMARASAAFALRWALEAASKRSPLVILVDDIDGMDGASRNALSDALLLGDLPGLLVVMSHEPWFSRPWLDDLPKITLKRFPHDIALEILDGSSLVESLLLRPNDVLPLYLEQLVRFERDAGTSPPPRLGDLVAARFARLPADRRRVLQAVAVLGPLALLDQVRALVGDDIDAGAAARDLVGAGILTREGSSYCMHHPFFRKIARAMTPAAVLRELHAKAMALAGPSLPLEVRAFHMQQAGDAFSALLSLESIGERARNRDDLDTALEAFRIGFELARRSAGDPDLDDPMHVVALFGWKLGESLSQMGRHGEADGILGESLDFASSIEQRARLIFSLARVARLRGKTQRAMQLAREAMGLASQRDLSLAATFEKEARRWQS